MKKANITKQKKQYKYSYPDNKALGSHLTGKDKALISEATGFSNSYVKLVMSGIRNNKKIIQAAKKIIEHKEILKKELNENSI